MNMMNAVSLDHSVCVVSTAWEPSADGKPMYDGPDLPSADLPEDHTGLEPMAMPLDASKISTHILGYETTCHSSRGDSSVMCLVSFHVCFLCHLIRFDLHNPLPIFTAPSPSIQPHPIYTTPSIKNLSHLHNPFPIYTMHLHLASTQPPPIYTTPSPSTQPLIYIIPSPQPHPHLHHPSH